MPSKASNAIFNLAFVKRITFLKIYRGPDGSHQVLTFKKRRRVCDLKTIYEEVNASLLCMNSKNACNFTFFVQRLERDLFWSFSTAFYLPNMRFLKNTSSP